MQIRKCWNTKGKSHDTIAKCKLLPEDMAAMITDSEL